MNTPKHFLRWLLFRVVVLLYLAVAVDSQGAAVRIVNSSGTVTVGVAQLDDYGVPGPYSDVLPGEFLEVTVPDQTSTVAFAVNNSSYVPGGFYLYTTYSIGTGIYSFTVTVDEFAGTASGEWWQISGDPYSAGSSAATPLAWVCLSLGFLVGFVLMSPLEK